jgi:hypothetical protein
MVKKVANNGLATYLLERAKQYAVPTALTGAGIAGLAHILSLYKEKQEQEKKQERPSELVVEVPVPKMANDANSWRKWLDSAAGVGMTVGGLGLGYAVVDQILKKKRQETLNNRLEKTKKEYSQYLAQELSPVKTAVECPTLDGLVLSIIETVKDSPVEANRKEAALGIIKEAQVKDPNEFTVGSSMLTGLPFLATLLAGHYLYYNRKKDIDRAIEKEEAESLKRTPQNIKIVTKPVPVTQNNNMNNPALLLEKGAVLEEAAVAARIIDKIEEQKKEEAAKNLNDGIVGRNERVLEDEDLQKIDDNTYVMLTEGGNTQIDALDPEALKILEQHKDKILKSFALGMNIKK